ncbi:hypothetical protein H4R35_005654 [Dimargaris xerosporica]|nr:hypothetical protein H4R35_005654 [Dimargaris xerosporica]
MLSWLRSPLAALTRLPNANSSRGFSSSQATFRSPLAQNFPPSTERNLGPYKIGENHSSGRSLGVSSSSPVVAYYRLNRILNENDVRREFKLRRRYEKPTQKRIRLKVERSNRRFNALVREKLNLVEKMRRL